MKYDIIIVGGGPGGLMAAKTAAKDGLKVLLIERKKNITEINRACSQIFYIRKLSASKAGLHGDGYTDPVSVELGPDKTTFHFPVPGFSLDYHGTILPYLNWIELSPSRHLIYRRKDTLWGFFYQKEVFLDELFTSAIKDGAEVRQETIGMAAENTSDGVKVIVRGKDGEEIIETKYVVAADGIASNIVDSLGMNEKRQILGSQEGAGLVCYELEGMETDLPPYSWVQFCIPSINRLMTIFMGQLADGKTQLTSGSEAVLQALMKFPNFAPWFCHASLVKKTASFSSTKYGLLSPIKEPVEGNVIVVGDAGSPYETWIQGAVASGYMAAKAIEKELDGQTGFPEYIDWWLKAFYFHKPEYYDMLIGMFTLANAWSCDDDVDHAYKLLQGKMGVPQIMIRENLEMFKDREELYNRLKKGYEEAEKMLEKMS